MVLIIMLLQPVVAWGPAASRNFCEQAVSTVWGREALKCLDDTVQYCLQIKALNETFGQSCLDAYAQGIRIDPAYAPASLFNDYERQVNHATCPLKWLRPSKEWICSDGTNAAGMEAQRWFDMASKAEDTCGQVRLFCTGSYYLSASMYPLNQVVNLRGCIGGTTEDLVDAKLASGEKGWTVNSQCTFGTMLNYAGVSRLNTQHVTFIIAEADYDAVSSNVTRAAAYVRDPSIKPPETTLKPPEPPSTSTTSTTLKAASSCPTAEPCDQKVKNSLKRIDSIIASLIKSMKTEAETPALAAAPDPNPLLMVLSVLILACLALMAYYILQVVPAPPSTGGKVVMPPSARKKMNAK